MAKLALRACLARKRLVVCVGSGGVGKTTLSAALALEAARAGRRALVLTIDPARRLADALGIPELGNEPRALPAARLAQLGVVGDGTLSAMMLDTKRSFDALVHRFAESEAVRERIFANRFYQQLSDALAGSAEYAAMERVHELSESRRFDLIVVDTPPSQHALDFLEAPQRLVAFLDGALVRLLLHPAFAAGRFGFRVFQRGARRTLHVLERVSGLAFLEDLSEFLLAFEGMSGGFRERAARARALLLGSQTAFVLASSPARDAQAQAELLRARLAALGAPLAGVIVNRVRVWPGGGEAPPEIAARDAEPAVLAALAEALARSEGAAFPAQEAARAALEATRSYAALVRAHAAAIQPLREVAEAQGLFFRRVPELPRDVHDLEALARVAAALAGGVTPSSAAGSPDTPRAAPTTSARGSSGSTGRPR
jgi:anion-transporting  ArsA/GET3 family ATPase